MPAGKPGNEQTMVIKMPTLSTCWPGVDLDGYTEFNPPKPHFQLFWNADVIDVSGVPSTKIIRVTDPFDVQFRVEIMGPGWQCMSGDWYFDLAFDEHGSSNHFWLSSKLPVDSLVEKGWRGCDKQCVEKTYTVPAGTISAGVYELNAKFQLYCCGKPAAIVGFDRLEEWMWF